MRCRRRPIEGRADLPHLAESEHLATDDLFVLIEALQLLGFAQVGGGDIEVTPAGRAFAEADLLHRKQIFAEHILRSMPLIAHIRKVLDERPGHAAPEGRFLAELEDHLSRGGSAARARDRDQLGPLRRALRLRLRQRHAEPREPVRTHRHRDAETPVLGPDRTVGRARRHHGARRRHEPAVRSPRSRRSFNAGRRASSSP